jgi:protein O-mannosyl-transferase
MINILKKNIVLVYCMLLVIGISIYVYSNVHTFDFINYDDNEYITENYALQQGITIDAIRWSFTAFHSNNWHPVTWISHLIDITIFGLNPSGHHVVNALFHIINVILLFILLYLMTGVVWPSLLAASLFAIHPTRAESVAWLAERKDVLSTFFMLLTIMSYTLYITYKGKHKYAKIIYYIFSLILFALGLMSKPMLVTLPCLLILLDFWPLNRAKYFQKNIHLYLEKIPFFLLTIASSILTYMAQHSMGAVQSMNNFPLLLRFQNASIAILRYVGKLFWPHPLVVFYPYNPDISILLWIISIFFIVTISIYFLFLYKKKPYLLVGWLWFLGTLVPVIGIVQVGTQAIADRYTYITFIGLFIIISWFIHDILKSNKNKNKIFALIIIVSLIILSPLSKRQVSYWKDPISLFEHQLKYETGTPLIINNLALSYSALGNLDKAIEYYNLALKINPTYFSVLNNLGSALSSKGDIDGSIRYYKKAIESEPNNRSIYRIYNNLGIAAYHQKRFKDAVSYFEKALNVNPNYYSTYNNLGVVLEQMNNLDDAIFYYRQGLQINPHDSGLYNNIGLAYGKKGNIDKAIEYFRKALQLNPNNTTAIRNLELAEQTKNESFIN